MLKKSSISPTIEVQGIILVFGSLPHGAIFKQLLIHAFIIWFKMLFFIFYSKCTMKVSVNVNNILKILVMIIVSMCLTSKNTKLIMLLIFPNETMDVVIFPLDTHGYGIMIYQLQYLWTEDKVMRAGNFAMNSNNGNLWSSGLDNMVSWYGHIP